VNGKAFIAVRATQAHFIPGPDIRNFLLRLTHALRCKVQAPGSVPRHRGQIGLDSGETDMPVEPQEIEGRLRDIHAREFVDSAGVV